MTVAIPITDPLLRNTQQVLFTFDIHIPLAEKQCHEFQYAIHTQYSQTLCEHTCAL